MSNQREDPKEQALRILGESTGKYLGRIRLLCGDSQEFRDAKSHVEQASSYAIKAIEKAFREPDG